MTSFSSCSPLLHQYKVSLLRTKLTGFRCFERMTSLLIAAAAAAVVAVVVVVVVVVAVVVVR